MSEELPFMKRLRGLATFSAIGTYPADTLLSDIQMIIVEVDWLRNERDRLHQETERLGDDRDVLLEQLQVAVYWIEQLTAYTNPDPSAPSKEELLPQLVATIAAARGEPNNDRRRAPRHCGKRRGVPSRWSAG